MVLNDVVSLLSNVATAIGLVFTAIAVRQAAKTSQGKFMLSLDQQLTVFDGIYKKIRSAHESGSCCQLLNDEEVLDLKEYMGFLEIVEVLIEGGSISERDFNSIFGHRIRALNENDQVQEILHKHPEKWVNFQKLTKRFAGGGRPGFPYFKLIYR